MFSKSCEYAIRSTIIICIHSKLGEKTNVKTIAKKAGVPEPYVAKIMQILSKQNIVQSSKGPGGGFFLNEKSKKIRLIDVVTAIDGDSLFTDCGLGMKECSEKNPCPLHNSFKGIRNDVKKMLQNTYISDLSENFLDNVFTGV